MAESGFRCFGCDDLIAEKLRVELSRPDGSLLDLGEWMGFPFQDGYAEREARYLELEKEVLSEVLGHLKRDEAEDGKVVVDTTGSVIYAGEALLAELKRRTTVVYLSASPEIRGKMLQTYIAHHRPVLWRGMYSRKPGESDDEAMARCYTELLTDRERRYERLADVTIGYSTRTAENFGVPEFIGFVREQSEKKRRGELPALRD